MTFVWRISAFFGDLAVERVDAKSCRIVATDVTSEEQKALDVLTTTALCWKWLAKGTIRANGETPLAASVEKVAKVLARALKPRKKLVHAVRFTDGHIAEITGDVLPAALVRTPAKAAESAQEAVKPVFPAVPTPPPPEPALATTVAKPVLGCPPPDFSPARLRAWNLLTAFLNSEQKADLERYNRFIAVGATSGHRYMVTSRTARDELQSYHRSLFDLDTKQPLCVHDWSIPPEEEMHALHILLTLPGHENYLRRLSE